MRLPPWRASRARVPRPPRLLGVAAALALALPGPVIRAQPPAPPPGTTGAAAPNLIPGGGDTSPPSAWLSPADGRVPAGPLAVTVNWCDDQQLLASARQITLDGVAVSTAGDGYTLGTYGGCPKYATSRVTVTIPADGAAHTLAANISDGTQTGGGTATYTVAAATGPVVTLVSPTLYRDPARCALACGEAVSTYRTPAYTSRDVARRVTLVYRSDRAHPMPVVEVDAQDVTPGFTPTWIELHLVDPNGAVVPLTHGAPQVLRRYQPGVPNRLAAQFDLGDVGGTVVARPYTAVVKTFDAGGNPVAEAHVPVRVLADGLNGPGSPFGAGWGLAGVQQLRWVGDGVVIVDGDGTMGYWAAGATVNGVQAFTSPPGDGSTVTFTSAAGTYARRYPDGTVVAFTGWGSEASRTDRLGNATRFTYVNNALPRSITDPAGHAITFDYRGVDVPRYGWRAGTAADVYDGTGRAVYLGVDSASGDLVDINDADRQHAQLNGYAAHRLVTQRDARGGLWQYGYDAFGALARATTPPGAGGGGTAALTTSVASWAAAELPARGTAAWGYPAGAPLPASAVRAAVTGPDGLTTRYALDGWGAAARVEAPGGVVATATRDARGRVTQTVDARGGVTRYLWNPTTPFLLDSVDDAAAKSGAHYTYDAANFYGLQQTRVKGREVEYRGYSAGRLASVRSGGADQKSTVYAYASGSSDPRPTSVTDPGGHVTTYTYLGSAMQNMSSATDPAGTTTFTYDAVGRDSVTSGPAGRSVQTYDVLNRPRQTTDGNNTTTTTAYDAQFPRTVTDALGQVYRDSVNALGLPFFSYDPGGHATSTAYDAAGRVASVTNRRGQTVSFGYDATLGFLNSRTTPDGANAMYGTDALGRVRWGSNAEGADSVWTDALGRDTLAVRRFAALPATRYLTVSRYDTLGRRIRRTLTRETGSGTRAVAAFDSLPSLYQYGEAALGPSARDRLLSAGNVSFGYNAEGAPATMGIGSGISVLMGSTDLHRLGTQRYTGPWAAGSGQDLDQAFGYLLSTDAAGRITQRYNASQSRLDEYQYDPAGRLKARVFKTAPNGGASCTGTYSAGYVANQDAPNGYSCAGTTYNVTGSEAYDWDAVGNPSAASGTSLVPNSGNEIAANAQQQFGYDADGNLATRYVNALGRNGQVFTWNSLGQLVQVVSDPGYIAGGPTVTFGYDAAGRRVRKTNVTTGGATFMLWDGDELLADLDARGDLVAEYVHHPEAVDVPLTVYVRAADGSLRPYNYLREAPGHVAGLLDLTTSQIAAKYTQYPPFGRGDNVAVLNAPNGWVNRLQYGGREYDVETGLYYNRARYYDPALRRFLSPDPSGLAGGINWYAYAGNDPVNHRDPTGLDTYCSWGQAYDYGNVPVGDQSYHMTAGNAWGCMETPDFKFNPADEYYGTGGYTAGSVGSGYPTAGAPPVTPNHPLVGGGPEALIGAGRLLTPAQPWLEGLGYIALLPVGGAEEGAAVAGERFLGNTGIRLIQHAVDRMAEREVTEAMVEVALRKGVRYFDPKYGTIAHILEGGFASGRSLTVWYDPLIDSITSVLRSSRNPFLRRYIPLP